MPAPLPSSLRGRGTPPPRTSARPHPPLLGRSGTVAPATRPEPLGPPSLRGTGARARPRPPVQRVLINPLWAAKTADEGPPRPSGAQTLTHTHASRGPFTRSRADPHTFPHSHVCTRARTRAPPRANLHTCAHTRPGARGRTHTRALVCTHTRERTRGLARGPPSGSRAGEGSGSRGGAGGGGAADVGAEVERVGEEGRERAAREGEPSVSS